MATSTTFVDLIKKNITALGATATIITTLVGAVLTIESRYAKAADLDGVKQYVIRQHEVAKFEQHQAIDDLRRQQLEDQIFELNQKPHPTSTDKAMIDRYKMQLDSVNNRLNRQAPPAATF